MEIIKATPMSKDDYIAAMCPEEIRKPKKGLKGYAGRMAKNMEITIGYTGYVGIMEKKMSTTIVYRGNGEENGNDYSI